MSDLSCSYCGDPARLVFGTEIYPHRADLWMKLFWHCAPCGAWVGCHQGTDTPLGRLANAELRGAKQRAHAAFDPLWQRKQLRDGCSKNAARGAGYAWLAKQLGVEPKDCHIGMFDVQQCLRVVEVCRSIGASA